MKKLVWASLWFACVWTACGPSPEEMLNGSWKAIAVEEEDSILQVDISTVGFTFNDQGRYTYSGNLNYHEAGAYYIEQQYLYTTDTTKPASTTKAVEIQFITPDSLSIKMKDNGKTRVMKCVRQ
jgi:hypothetical protein